MPPETSYVRVGSDRLACQVLGKGPPDLVFTMGPFSHVDIVWEDPQMALFLRRLASFSRLIRFDRRGTDASDPLPQNPLPPWEAYTQELTAVMDAAGLQRAALRDELGELDVRIRAGLHTGSSSPARYVTWSSAPTLCCRTVAAGG